MSAWLCGKGTLSCVVDIIHSKDFKENYDTEKCYSSKSNEELINILSDLNTKSLNCRYGKDVNHILSDEDRVYVPLNVPFGQKFKSLCCYTYQTCECDENYSHPLFKALDKFEDCNYEKFQDDWEDYHWDIDAHID